MKLTVLGSGTAVLRKQRKSACYLLDTGKELFLFDCGLGVTNIVQTQYDLQKIDHIFITHPHVDHCGSLMNVLQSMLVSGMYYPKSTRRKPLFLHGYKGFKKDYAQLRKIVFPESDEPYVIQVSDYLNARKKLDDFTLEVTEIHHVPERFHAVSYRIESGGKVFVYSGDCGFDKRLIKLSRQADLAVFEMSMSPAKYKKQGPAPNHLSPFECGLIAAKAGVKKLALVHWYDDTPQKEILKEVRKNFKGQVIIPDDLQVLTF